MIFYSWASKMKAFNVPDGRTVVCDYRVFTFMFVLRVVYKKKWRINSLVSSSSSSLTGEQQQDPGDDWTEVDGSTLAQLFEPEDAPRLGFWERYSLLAGLALLGAFMVWGIILSMGRTSVDSIEVGDCFIDSTEEEVSDLETPGCEEPHDSQVTAIFDLVGTSSDYRLEDESFAIEVYERCVEASLEAVTRIEEISEEAYISFLSPTEDGWKAGDREVVCYLFDEGGLEGSFVETGLYGPIPGS